MTQIPLKTLIGKLNPQCRLAAERAASLCMARGHFEVEIEHLMLALLEQFDSDFGVILARHHIAATALAADIERELLALATGNTRTPVFSSRLPRLFEQAWLLASLDSRSRQIRSAHLLLALLTVPELAQLAARASSQFAAIRLEQLKHDLDTATLGSVEQAAVGRRDGDRDDCEAAPVAPAGPNSSPALERFTTNLTRQAREGRIDPVIGRDAEIRQCIDILMRRRQNNPILTGEPGVGKTAVVEGLARRIAAGEVPPPLREVELHVLDIGLLQAGASVRGEFESRLRKLIDEVRQSARPVILFIDEAHTIIGAGGQSGQGDAANLLKPALARGELRTIAATTWAEYKKYFEKDAALARRFQLIKVEEPDELLAAAMLRGIVPLMESHFGVRVLDEAVTEAVRLSHRYITERQLPDKAISVLDTACARVALAQSSLPARIDDAQMRLQGLRSEVTALEREANCGAAHGERLAALAGEIAQIDAALAEDHARHRRECEMVAEISALRAGVESAGAASPRATLEALVNELRAIQGDAPMVPAQVDGHAIAEIVASWTGVPLGRMVKDEIDTVLRLVPLLKERVIGQDHALDAVAQRVRTARAHLEDPHKPKGVFLFVGPSGVGKTETALALAEVLYGGERKLITINMSEYQEAHSVSGLKGSPPGYVGFGEGGVLTEAVRRNPYSVVLLDEVEKAHPDVLELFFQVFDKGRLDDAEGREIDFRNTVIILTSNVGSSQIMQACLSEGVFARPDPEALGEALRPVLYKQFKPAFLGRMKVVPYFPVDDDTLVEIIRLKLGRIGRRIRSNHRADFGWSAALEDAVLARCTEVDSGARNVDHILNGTLLPTMAETVLGHMSEGREIGRIRVGANKRGEFTYRVS